MERLKDRDLLSALVLIFVGVVSLSQAGTDPRNWIFPLLATYVIFAIAAALLARVVWNAAKNRLPDLIDWQDENRVIAIDLVVFSTIVLAYVLSMYRLGFWLSSFVMLLLVSVYLTLERTRRNMTLAVFVPLAACVVAYFVFQHVFYVPVPTSKWWPWLG